MKRNLAGKYKLSQIIEASIEGMELAVERLHHLNVRAGLILCMAREFPANANEVILERAIRYKDRGIVGIDLAGPERPIIETGDLLKAYADLYRRAREAGLKTTIHTGETTHTGARGVRAVLRELNPDRFGHAIQAWTDPGLLTELCAGNKTLEFCPPTYSKEGWTPETLHQAFNTFWDRGVKFTVNTDGSRLMGTNILETVKFLLEKRVLTEQQITQTFIWARESSFLGAQ